MANNLILAIFFRFKLSSNLNTNNSNNNNNVIIVANIGKIWVKGEKFDKC